jgi:hypothetical protein
MKPNPFLAKLIENVAQKLTMLWQTCERKQKSRPKMGNFVSFPKTANRRKFAQSGYTAPQLSGTGSHKTIGATT